MCDSHGCCLWCDGPTKRFRSSGRHQKFCCRAHKMKWQRAGNQRLEENQNKTCLQCGLLFVGYQTKSRFCSRKCSIRFRYDHPTGDQYKCRQCGVLFIPKKADRTTYCSQHCALQYRVDHRQHHPQTHIKYCRDCGKPIARACKRCTQCAREYTLVSAREWYYANKEYRSATLTCMECKKQFTVSRYLNTRRKYCSEKCSKRVWKKDIHRKRSRVYGVEHDKTVTLSVLMIRDGGRCQVCGHKVKRTKKHAKRRATLGHIKAMSKGGTHTWDNVQLECWECNTKYGDVTHGNLRLPI